MDTFKYDPFGRRIHKSFSSGTSIFAYDGDNLVETVNSSGGVVARYVRGQEIDEALAELNSGTSTYYEQDGLGSVTSLTSGAGSLVQTYKYDSFGKLSASSGSVSNSFQYTARDFDTETGLYYYRARYYDPAAGRFLSEDPLQFRGGQANSYTYVGNGPTNWIDPTGWIHQGPDGRLHDDPAGGLEILCRNNRNKARDIKMLETSILVRTAELAEFGDDADQGHIDRLAAEEATLARCRECEKEKPEPRDVPIMVPQWKKWLERNRTPLLVTGAVVAGAEAIALAPATGGASLLVFATP
jgi:RHS repeat-associated protein